MSRKNRRARRTGTLSRAAGEWITAADDPKGKSAVGQLLIADAGSTIDITAAEEGKAAQARSFKMVAYTGGEMRVSAFFYPVVIELSGLSTGNSPRPILVDHEQSIDAVLGQTEKVDVVGNHLVVEGKVFGESDKARQVIGLNDRGFKFQASVGVSVLNREFVAEGQSVTVNGRKFTGPINVARKSVLGEVSFVSLGADDNTSARIAAKAAEGTLMDFAKWVEAKGFTLADLSDAQKASLQAAYDAEQALKNKPATSAGGTSTAVTAGSGELNDILARERDEAKRVREITDITAKALRDYPAQIDTIEALSRSAIDNKTAVQDFELAVLRAMRPRTAPAIHVAPGDEALTGQTIEAALCLSGGIEKPEKHFKAEVLEAAQKRFRHGLGLVELFQLFARRNGQPGMSNRDLRGLLRASFAEANTPRWLQASSPSTYSLSGILGNTANKFLRMGFDSVESTWRGVAAIRPVKDFKQVSSYTLTGDFEYKQLAPGGKLEHATAGEETYTNQADTYGRMFGIDRRDLINDDLGALTQVPRRLGRGAALKFNVVFWTEFLADHTSGATVFPTDNSKLNYISGATPGTNDSRMTVEGLTRAETSFFNQLDPNSKPLGITPEILLVPNALAVTASELMRSTEIRDTTASTNYATGNPHSGKFTVVRSSYLSNSAMGGGYSTAAWYMLANPSNLAFIEVAFLNGVETPTVESADADFDSLGIQLRGYHDFGVNKQEYRAAVKSKGAA